MTDERKVLNDARQELYLLERVDLLGDRWLDDQGAVAVDEK